MILRASDFPFGVELYLFLRGIEYGRERKKIFKDEERIRRARKGHVPSTRGILLCNGGGASYGGLLYIHAKTLLLLIILLRQLLLLSLLIIIQRDDSYYDDYYKKK